MVYRSTMYKTPSGGKITAVLSIYVLVCWFVDRWHLRLGDVQLSSDVLPFW